MFQHQSIRVALTAIILQDALASVGQSQLFQLVSFPQETAAEAEPVLPPPPASPEPGLISVPYSPEAAEESLAPRPAALEASDLALPINLAAALKLADARPLVVVAAQARSWIAEAQLQRAQVWWVPQLNLGGAYVRHDGYGPDFNRGINTESRPLNQNVNFLYTGGGLTNDHATTDIIFMPLAARQTLNSRRWDIQSAKNDAVLETATAYFNVHRARGKYAAASNVVERGHKLVEGLVELSRDLIPKVEVERARRLLAQLEQDAALARETWRVSSADLTQVLRLDPRAVVNPIEHDHLQVTLIDSRRPLDELMPIALTNRPELASQQALVQEVIVRIRQEKARPLVPSLMLNGFQTPQELIQFGAQGIGRGDKLNLWSARSDFSPQLLWQAEGLGLGNYARIKEQRAQQSLAIVELLKIQDHVAADVTRIQARLQSAAVRVHQADRSLRQALITYNGSYEGLRQTKRFENVLIQVYRPQEVVIALEHLWNAYEQYFGTVADYNIAQFQMFHALGYPARQLVDLFPAGEAMSVDTERPGYLPPVSAGPPPATR